LLVDHILFFLAFCITNDRILLRAFVTKAFSELLIKRKFPPELESADIKYEVERERPHDPCTNCRTVHRVSRRIYPDD